MRKQVIGLMILFMIGLVSASMPLPHAFYGKVYYSDGALIGESLEFTAKLDGEEFSSVLSNGEYDLVVESESEGETIYFYIEGVSESIGDFIFESFEITELDFTTDIPNPHQIPSNGGDDDNGNGGSPGGGSPSSDTPIIITPKTTSILDDEENEILNSNGDQETSSGITGAVIGFIKSGKGIGLIFTGLIIIVGIGVIAVSRKKR